MNVRLRVCATKMQPASTFSAAMSANAEHRTKETAKLVLKSWIVADATRMRDALAMTVAPDANATLATRVMGSDACHLVRRIFLIY